MDLYVLMGKPVSGSRDKFENHQIVKYTDDLSIKPQLDDGFVTALGPASLRECVNELKELSADKSGWFALTVAQYALIFIVTIAFVAAIIWGASGLSRLLEIKEAAGKTIQSQDESARFLITFLVAVGTIAIAFLAILTAMVIREYKERFAAAKEVLILLIGILGTIVGFYFGAAKNQSVAVPDNVPPANGSVNAGNSGNQNPNTAKSVPANANSNSSP